MSKALVVVKPDRDAIAIGKLWSKACQSLVDSNRYYIECGLKLIDKKSKLAHGEWLPWLKVNREVLGFDSRRTASMLMKAAANGKLTSHLSEADAATFNRQLWGNTSTRGTQGTGDNEWYTPIEILNAVREVLGAIDLDPASSKHAQRTVKAGKYFTIRDNGLTKEWHGTVWLNPPYAQPYIEEFADKMIEEVAARRVLTSIMLTHNYTDTAWFQKLAASAAAICFPRGRIRFIDPDGELASPTQGQALFFFGADAARFNEVFSPLGFVMRPVGVSDDGANALGLSDQGLLQQEDAAQDRGIQ